MPACCSLCANPLLRLSALPVCQQCWDSLEPQKGRLCACCGEDLGISEFSTSNVAIDMPASRGELCRPCEAVPPDFERALAFGLYEDRLRKLIHLLKYDRMERVAVLLGRRMARQVAEVARDSGGDMVVVPVPLHRSKRRERGFNQACLLARAAMREARRLEPEISLRMRSGVLERRRATESQTGLSSHQRRRNLRGAFFVSEKEASAIVGRPVLLIDDIYTTGATARACSRVLKRAGAKSVWVVTAARAQREGVARWDSASVGGSAAMPRLHEEEKVLGPIEPLIGGNECLQPRP